MFNLSDLKTGMLVIYKNGDKRIVLLDTAVGHILKDPTSGMFCVLHQLDKKNVRDIYKPTSTAFNYTDLQGMERIYTDKKLLVFGGAAFELSNDELKELKEEICQLLQEQ